MVNLRIYQSNIPIPSTSAFEPLLYRCNSNRFKISNRAKKIRWEETTRTKMETRRRHVAPALPPTIPTPLAADEDVEVTLKIPNFRPTTTLNLSSTFRLPST